MEKVLWYLLAGTRGGTNRARIIRLLDDRPHNANQLANALEVDYNTVRHHLDTLMDHNVIESGGETYGELYFLTDQFDQHRDEFERIIDRADTDVIDENLNETDTKQTNTETNNPE